MASSRNRLDIFLRQTIALWPFGKKIALFQSTLYNKIITIPLGPCPSKFYLSVLNVAFSQSQTKNWLYNTMHDYM
jgi:hypothetical protein